MHYLFLYGGMLSIRLGVTSEPLRCAYSIGNILLCVVDQCAWFELLDKKKRLQGNTRVFHMQLECQKLTHRQYIEGLRTKSWLSSLVEQHIARVMSFGGSTRPVNALRSAAT